MNFKLQSTSWTLIFTILLIRPVRAVAVSVAAERAGQTLSGRVEVGAVLTPELPTRAAASVVCFIRAVCAVRMTVAFVRFRYAESSVLTSCSGSFRVE